MRTRQLILAFFHISVRIAVTNPEHGHKEAKNTRMTAEEFKIKYMQGFNPQQIKAATAVEGPLLLLAVPGSGKTTVMITRMAYMVLCCGINPQSILALTYTVSAANEMKQRYLAMCGEGLEGIPEFRTINGICAKIIARYSSKFGRGKPFDLLENEAETAKIISEVYLSVNNEYIAEAQIKEIRTAITYIKNMEIPAEEIRGLKTGIPKLELIYEAYNAKLRERKCMDYDDQMVYAKTILEKFPAILDEMQEHYRFVCVDEAQDTSEIQHSIIKLLSRKYGNVYMVGDEDQSIYGFRAAYPEALYNFESDYPGASVLYMETNYRSTGDIVDLSDAFASANSHGHEKSVRPAREARVPVEIEEIAGRDGQYKRLLHIARSCSEQTAVLYRSNDSAIPLIDLLERNKINYNCRKFDSSFFTHRVVTDISQILSFALDPSDAGAFMHIYYKLGYYITKPVAQYACRKAGENGSSVLDELVFFLEDKPNLQKKAQELRKNFTKLKSKTGSAAIEFICNDLNYGKYVSDNGLDVNKLDILYMISAPERSSSGILRRLEELRDITSSHENRPGTPFILSTVHASKGLEYNNVYIIDVIDGIFPVIPKIECIDDNDRKLYEEERRILYVGMTRAKNKLTLFSCAGESSEFIKEIKKILKYGCSFPRGKKAAPGNRKYDIISKGDTVTHKKFGSGTVDSVKKDIIEIRFDNAEYGTKRIHRDAFAKGLIVLKD